MNIVETEALTKEWDGKTAVHQVSLTIPAGAVYALVGPNGAGKTTLLRMLAGLLEPTSGSARVAGFDLQENPREAHKQLGFLADFFELYRELTVSEYLQYFARAYRLEPGKREAKVEEVLARVNLSDRAGSPVDHLSRGMRQRVAIARSLINDPALILLDEPAAGLDPEARHELQVLFRSLAAEGRTLLVSSHILSELEEYCTHVAIMQKGRLVAAGALASFHGREARKHVKLRLLEKAEEAEALLRGNERWLVEARNRNEIRLSYSGDETVAVEIIRCLVAGGLPLASFAEAKGAMQEIYLSLMKGKSE
jgi:ABC-2 type transport system ATP-binding protein